MWSRVRPPLIAVVVLLVGLMALLATLQYRWLGQISEAERERMQSTLKTGASEFALDVDRELTRAYLLYQIEPGTDQEMSSRLVERNERWQATSRFPRLLKDVYVYSQEPPGTGRLRHFDPKTGLLAPADWPASMSDWQQQLGQNDVRQEDPVHRTVLFARMSQPIWEKACAIVSPMPLPFMFLNGKADPEPPPGPRFSYAIIAIDSEYLKNELLPSLAERHFSRGGASLDLHVAVVRTASDGGLIYSSDRSFVPSSSDTADASADFFQVRTQDFATLAAEVRRFATFTTAVHTAPSGRGSGDKGAAVSDFLTLQGSRPLSIVVQPNAGGDVSGGVRGSTTTTTARFTTLTAPRWKLMLRHRAGSLEAAVGSVRRRNLIVSTSILGVLAASMGLLVLSTRRAQRLASQQMEFVAAVSHELRTPLAVIRSAAENLADGVVREEDQVKKYGDLMRTEGRRLTEMVEQILELAGIQSGQRGFALRAVAIEPLLHDIVSSSGSIIEQAGIVVDVQMSPDVPPVLGDEVALRRVFQNLIGNAIKYGASGKWIGLSAARSGSEVRVTVADRGIGIQPAEQARIFEPFYRASDAVSAQIHGAGLGLSLVQRIVESHGGRVTVRSTPGQGSEFTVQLPAAGEEASARPVGSAQPVSSS
jgi:signal transduction histidine kinase